jgi:hypothetical protein
MQPRMAAGAARDYVDAHTSLVPCGHDRTARSAANLYTAPSTFASGGGGIGATSAGHRGKPA